MFFLYRVFFLSLVFFCSAFVVNAEADTVNNNDLYSILETVYQTHPALLAERATQEKTKEQIKEAKTGWRPDITIRGNANSALTEPSSFGTKTGETANIGLSVTQSLYKGGRTIAKTHEAELLSKRQEARFQSIEQIILLDAISAYIDILKDDKLNALKEKNVENLKERLLFEEARHELGENTITDLSQAKARLAASEAGLVQSKGQLANDIAKYKRVIGMPAPVLKDIVLPVLDINRIFTNLQNLEDAVAEGLKNHPDIIQAKMLKEANMKAQRSIKGELYPVLALVGDVQRSFRPIFSSAGPYQDQSQVSLQASMNLYAGGSIRSRLKQLKYDGNRLSMEQNDVERNIEEGITIAWQDLAVLHAEKISRVMQVEAANIALEGVREEFSLGGRTTLDVLDAEEEKLDADVALTTVEHDLVLAEFILISSTGQLYLEKIANILQ